MWSEWGWMRGDEGGDTRPTFVLSRPFLVLIAYGLLKGPRFATFDAHQPLEAS